VAERCGLAKAAGAVPCPAGLIAVERSDAKGEVALPAGVVARPGDGSVRTPLRFEETRGR